MPQSNIRNQSEHHRSRSFQEEYLALLEKHGVAHDERYLWEEATRYGADTSYF